MNKDEIQKQLETKKKAYNIRELSKYEAVSQAAIEIAEQDPDEVMSYGYDWLDNKLVGIFIGELILIGGESGSGKSTFANSIIEKNSAKFKCGMFSLEETPISISKKELYFSIVKSRKEKGLPGYTWRDFITGRLNHLPDFIEELGEETEKHKMRKIFYQDVNGVPSAELIIERLKFMADLDYKLILIDHLHYIDLRTEESRANRIEEIMTALTTAIKELKIAVLMVAHYRKLDGKKPTIDSFKDSMSIPQNASSVINLWRNRDEGVDDEERRKTLFLIPKSRQLGAEGVITGQYDIETGQYAEYKESAQKIL